MLLYNVAINTIRRISVMKIIPCSRKRYYLVRVSNFVILVALIAGILGCSAGSHLDPYAIPEDAVLVADETIGGTRAKYWVHVIDDVFYIKNDYISMQLDLETNEIVKFEKKWRDVSTNLTAIEIKPFEPPSGGYFWKIVAVFLEQEDIDDFYTFFNAHEYPLICWEVRYYDGTTIMYDLDGNEIGYGVPVPSDGA
jgi:hypothetical protein